MLVPTAVLSNNCLHAMWRKVAFSINFSVFLMNELYQVNVTVIDSQNEVGQWLGEIPVSIPLREKLLLCIPCLFFALKHDEFSCR